MPDSSPLLTPDAGPAPAASLDTSPPAADHGTAAVRPDDAMVGAAEKLFGSEPPKTPDTPEAVVEGAKPIEGETPEQKAEREAREAAETPEQKAEREKIEAKAALDKERYGAPEGDYEFKTPEGIVLDPALTGDVATLAKELDLSPQSAQKVIDLGVKMRQADAENLTKVHDGWIASARADKEFGGDKLNESLATAQRALKEFGTPELNELIVGAKLGNHPEIIRLLTRVGHRISEAPVINAGKPGASGDAASVLYPTLKRQS